MVNTFEDPAVPDTRSSSILSGGYNYSTTQHSGTQIINLACLLETARSYYDYHSLDILLPSKNGSNIVPAFLLRKLQPLIQTIWHNIAFCPVDRPEGFWEVQSVIKEGETTPSQKNLSAHYKLSYLTAENKRSWKSCMHRGKSSWKYLLDGQGQNQSESLAVNDTIPYQVLLT